MRVALIRNAYVFNVIETEVIPEDNFNADLAIESDTANIGDTYIDEVFIAPEPIITPDPVIPINQALSISSFQAKAALAQFGLLGAVNTYMSAADDITRLRWEEAMTFSRDNESLLLIATEIGITEEQLDELFALGATITL